MILYLPALSIRKFVKLARVPKLGSDWNFICVVPWSTEFRLENETESRLALTVVLSK